MTSRRINCRSGWLTPNWSACGEGMNRAAWSARSAVRLVAWLLIETAAMRCVQPGSTVLRDREALVRVVRTCGEGVMQAGSLHHSFPARSAPSGWDRPIGKKRVPAGRGAPLARLRYGDAPPAQNGGSRLKRRGGLATPALVGVAFGVGWTPCIGPTLAAILALAGRSTSPFSPSRAHAPHRRAGALP